MTTALEPYWRAGAPERRTLKPALRVSFAGDRRRLRIGLVNNMPDAAMAATERQFRGLAEAAAPERRVEFELFHVPEVTRGPEVAARLRDRSRPTAEVGTAGLDALIVTGTEPRAAELRAEPFWDTFARLADEAQASRLPVLWSCLAAHAAVLHLDGVPRRALPRKCSGLYACEPTDHPLTAGMDARWLTPHSRSNALDEPELIAAGYRILSRSPEAGVDAFTGAGRASLFLFLQGHPEYEPNALPLEFKRDLQRYLTGARETPPDLPCGVFSGEGFTRLSALLEAARSERSPELMARWPLPSQLSLASQNWRIPAARLLRNWLVSALETEQPREAAARLPA